MSTIKQFLPDRGLDSWKEGASKSDFADTSSSKLSEEKMSEDIGVLVESEAVAVLDETPQSQQRHVPQPSKPQAGAGQSVGAGSVMYLVKGPAIGLLECPTPNPTLPYTKGPCRGTVRVFGAPDCKVYVLNGQVYDLTGRNVSFVEENGAIRVVAMATEATPYMRTLQPLPPKEVERKSDRLPALGAYLKQQNDNGNGNGHHK